METTITRIVKVKDKSPAPGFNSYIVSFLKKGETKSMEMIMNENASFLLSESTGVGIEAITA